MPLYIKDETTTQLVNQLAKLRGLTKQAAVHLAVATELQRAADAVPLHKQFAELRKTHPLPPATGDVADKAFFDDLSGGL
jgi:antitoxin VapB